MTSKQRAYLRGLANTMEPILHAGKGGISDAMIKQADDALAARELIKGKVLETAPGTAREIAEEIAAKVNADEEDTYHALVHIAESGKASWTLGECPCCDTFAAKA